jgi:hypothetical protein
MSFSSTPQPPFRERKKMKTRDDSESVARLAASVFIIMCIGTAEFAWKESVIVVHIVEALLKSLGS